MNAEFYQGNRQRLYDSLPDHTLLLLFSGSSIRKTADENYPFYADRSFPLSDRHWAGTHSPDGRERRRRGTGNTLHTSAGYAGRAVDREAVHTGGGQGAIRGRADRIERRVGKPSETS